MCNGFVFPIIYSKNNVMCFLFAYRYFNINNLANLSINKPRFPVIREILNFKEYILMI